MKIDDKYLPTVEDRILFIQNRIGENKKQMHGGQLEVLMATANGEARSVKQVEDQMEQIQKNIDIYEQELAKLKG